MNELPSPEVDPLGERSLMADVRLISGMGWKRNGSPAARAAAEHFRREFARNGLETTVESWPYNAYYPQEWAVTMTAGGPNRGSSWEANSIPIWYSRPGTAEGDLVYIDARRGPPDVTGIDLRGKVVLADVSYFANFLPSDGSSVREAGLYAAVVEAGAVSYVRKAGAPGNSVMLMHFAQNFATHDAPPQLGAIPAFTVGQADFEQLRIAAEEGDARVTTSNVLTDVPKGGERLISGGSLGPGDHLVRAVIDDVVGVLPGDGDDVIVVAAHYDTTFDGAVDNATGDAVLLGLMRHYAAKPRSQRAKTLVFLASGGHDTGDFDLYHFVERHADGLLKRTVAFNWLDHMAADVSNAASGNTISHGVLAAENAPLREQLTRVMQRHDVPVQPMLGPASTISHLPAEVPSYNVTLAPSWYHSPEDTCEKVPASELANMAAAQLALLDSLMESDGAAIRRANRSGSSAPTADVAAKLGGTA